MRTQNILEARDLVAFAAQALDGLGRGDEQLATLSGVDEERSWLAAARRRVSRQHDRTQAALDGATALPEFAAARQAASVQAFTAWLDSIEALAQGISDRVSAKNPLIEVLFPHLKFDKLRRGGAAARAYMSELERRRMSAYVVRLSAEPEYAFLPALLAQVDAARARLTVHEAPCTLALEALDALRNAVFDHADALRSALVQARLLAEAALSAHPGLLDQLGLDAKPRRRVTRGAAATEAQPTP
jgi:hypothetical protein